MNTPCRRRAIWAAERAGIEDVVVPAAPVPTPQTSKYLCPKCGKEYRRGMYFHFKNCRGKL